jgi:hypothetical protein
VSVLIFSALARNALRRGFKNAEMSWILESNPKSFLNVEHLGGKIYKTYRIYEKALAPAP